MDERLRKQQELYDRIWREGLSKGKDQYGNLQTNLQFLKETGLLWSKRKTLEVGCGVETIVFELTRLGHAVVGIDISQEAIAHGLEKYGDVDLRVGAAEELPFANEMFDLVLSFDLLEHIAEVDQCLSEAHRVIRSGGYYLFQTPNKYFNAVFETLSQKSMKWRQVHQSLHTPRQLRERLKKHGFEVEFARMNTVNEFTLNKLKRYRPLRYIMKHLDFRRFPLLLQTNLYVISRKK
jgi:2-polyprenyl-3-methyl-5-hydroxy-6-metoxy-1,4-benzoquinol methylase